MDLVQEFLAIPHIQVLIRFANGRVQISPLVRHRRVRQGKHNEAVQPVANTPCARAKGAIEIRPLLQSDGD